MSPLAIAPQVKQPLREPSAPPERLYSSMEGKWTSFIAALRERVAKTNIEWDGRAVGMMAYLLTDRRRNERAIIALELAEEIAALHGTWKSYNFARSTIGQWLTVEIQNEFERRVEQATSKIRT